MGAKGVLSFILVTLLLFPLAAVVSQTNRDPQQLPLPLANEINLDEIDEDTAELIWTKCGAELTFSTEAFQDLQCIGNDNALVGKERILKALSMQDTQVKKTIQECLKDRSTSFPVSGEDTQTRKWYLEYLVSFFPRSDDEPRVRRLAEVNAPTPSPPPPLKPKKNVGKASPGSETTETAVNSGTHEKIIIAVVVTATVTFSLAALLFFCCFSNSCGAGGGNNDEKPLLSLSMSDYSANGASQKSHSLHSSVHKGGNLDDQSLYANSNLEKIDPSLDASVDIPLEPPPGRVSVSGLPPLKPPPGRAQSTLKPRPIRNESSLRPVNKPPAIAVPAAPPPPPAPAPAPAPPAPPAPPPPAAPPPPPPAPAPSVRPPPGPPPPPAPRGGPPPPPKPFGAKGAPGPPPPPMAGPRAGSIVRPPRPSAGASQSDADAADPNKAKLKPFFWDKVMANPDQSMVWHQIRAGSFQFNEEMIETLFGYNPNEKSKGHNRKNSSSGDPSLQFIQIIEPKKAQNLSILLKALNVTTQEVCDALKEGNELPIELIQTLIKMAPTGEEELKLRLYSGDLSRLGTAERFLKVLVEIPFAFRRLESMLFMCSLQEEEPTIKENFQTLEAACKELRKSRLFLKLLEAVLKTGNRMNSGTFRGSAQAFKLDTLLKLSDVKGVDGKTTLLHFVVQEIIRTEGIKAARRETKSFSSFKSEDILEEPPLEEDDKEEYYRTLGLQVVSGLSNELQNVKKAAIIDADAMNGSVSKLGHALLKSRDFLTTDMQKIEEEDEFQEILKNFMEHAEKEVMWMLEEEKRIMSLVKETADYFHGNSAKDEGLRLFTVVRDFLIILDKVCKEIKTAPLKAPKSTSRKDSSSSLKKDGSPPKSAAKKEGSSPQKKDGSPPEITDKKEGSSPQKKDGSPPKTTERKGGSSPQKKDDQSTSGTAGDPSGADQRQLLFPAIQERRMYSSSSSSDED